MRTLLVAFALSVVAGSIALTGCGPKQNEPKAANGRLPNPDLKRAGDRENVAVQEKELPPE